MNRRKFILLGTAGVTALFSFGYYHWSNKTSPSDPTEPYSLLEIMDSSDISTIGKKYLEVTPEENDRITLKQILLNIASRDSLAVTPLFASIRNDFTANQLVILDGWILSKTEARQCALYFLNH